jgi:uncharacterized membrane protein
LLFAGGAYYVSLLRNKDKIDNHDTPRDILNFRLAKGDINLYDYEVLSRQIEQTGGES